MPRYDLVVRSIEPDELTLDVLATHAGMHPAVVERFIDCGLIQPIRSRQPLIVFDPSRIRELRSIQRLRNDLGINIHGIAVVLDLLDRLRDLQRENALLRSRI